jgi:hypothetical protein
MTQSRIGRVVGSAGNPFGPTDSDHWALSLIHPTGSEVWGTKVTFWDGDRGAYRAFIIRTPYASAFRAVTESDPFLIAYQDDHGSTPNTGVPASMLTLGWHPDALPAVDR